MDQKFKLRYPTLLIALAVSLSGLVFAAETKADEQVDKTQDAKMEVITISGKGLISYVSASASKTDMPIIETPSSISVLTDKRIADLGAESLQDAIGYVAGVYNGPYGVDTRGDWAQIRGVSPLQYQDGLQMMFGNYNNVRINPYMLQQIEILKGPSSVLYGQGSTGGIINMVTKRPEAEQQAEIWAQVGNYNRKQLAGDITGSLNDDESVLYRLTGLYRDSETQTDYVDDNSYFIAPAITWYATDTTKLTLLANLQKNESGSSTQFFPHKGTLLPAPNGQIPSSRFISEPGWDQYDTEQKSVTLLLEQELNDYMSLYWSSRYVDSKATYRTMYAWPPKFQDDGRSILRNVSMSDSSAQALTSDLRLQAEFDTGSVEHNLTFGIDYQDVDTDTDRLYIPGAGGLLDLYNPKYGVNTGSLPTGDDIPDTPGENNNQLGIYIQDSIKLGKVIVSGALRHDRVESNTTKYGKQAQSATTGRLGLMYSFDSGIAPYVSYSQSFQPIYGSNEIGTPFKPQEGEQYELGVKYQPAGTEHLLTASIFDISDKNRKQSDGPNLTRQLGEVQIQGLELEAQLEWQEVDVYASYAYTDSEKHTNKVGEVGAKLAAMPDHMLSTWVTYRPQSFWHGFKAGLGFRYVGETSDGSVDVLTPSGTRVHTALNTEAYHVFDLMLGYEFSAFDLSLNIDNVADETVITSCLARGDCFYGQRRTVTANVKYKF
ncbi:TonB-dependent siderophore receptor [Shewanella sp. D64]|uniref:TonB-dependent siderophore receptor n=1 Tax=unclassified Shewanella TaxID=196818 RepID=UPI0022BA6DC5|nr:MULTISPECIES: TonB-dependent siderophore receptor [unclassified Shewanella]MEC4728107.1 TonB-dependent siderophore receptor [Shewanella sp. D64]MEC4740227.1 TonB-dependent siderophore receptor [Shewanella sp. E94]WBJ94454.1 TonB-dependent siderophore receptor [Shewanella sp. MTB7]